MKAYLVIENFGWITNSVIEPTSGFSCTLFTDRKRAEQRLGTFRRNQQVEIVEIELQKLTEVAEQ